MSDDHQTELVRELIQEMIGKARGGNRASALRLMENYCYALSNGSTPPREILAYFGTAFRDILEDEEDHLLTAQGIEKALNLERPHHRQKARNSREHRNREMLVAAKILSSTRGGISELRAISNVAQDIAKWQTPWLTLQKGASEAIKKGSQIVVASWRGRNRTQLASFTTTSSSSRHWRRGRGYCGCEVESSVGMIGRRRTKRPNHLPDQ